MQSSTFNSDYEKVALQHYHNAFRQTSPASFSAEIQRAMTAQEKALQYISAKNSGEGSYSRGFLSFLQYWLTTDSRAKREALDRAWNHAKKALQTFEKKHQYDEYARTYVQFSFAAALSICYDLKYAARVRRAREIVAIGRRAVSLVPYLTRSDDIARVLVKTALFLDTCADEVSSGRDRARVDSEAVRYWKKAQEISPDQAWLAGAGPPSGFYRIFNEEESISICTQALNHSKAAGDCFGIAWLTDQMGPRTYWKARRETNPDNARKLADEALRYSETADREFRVFNFTSPNGGIMWAHSPHAEHFNLLGGLETAPGKRISLLEKSFAATPELIRLAEPSGFSEIWYYAHHMRARAAIMLADMETVPSRKEKLYEIALKHRKLAIEAGELHIPPTHWNRAFNLRYLAQAKTSLADLQADSKARQRMLLDALNDLEKSLRIGVEYTKSLARSESHLLRIPLAGLYGAYGDFCQKYSGILEHGEDWIRKAAHAYLKAAEWYRNTPRYSELAESYWKAAQAYAGVQAYLLAAENYQNASKSYTIAAEKLSHVKESYRDRSLYMKALSRSHRAKEHRSRAELHHSGSFYREAAHYLEQSSRWKPLACQFLGMAKLESAEVQSREGEYFLAAHDFEESAKQFHVAKEAGRELSETLDNPIERQMVESVLDPSMENYALGKLNLEKARISDGRGDMQSASEQYALAADQFEQSSKTIGLEDRSEPKSLSLLSKAWHFSKLAELKESNELMGQAQELFKEARKSSESSDIDALATACLQLSLGMNLILNHTQSSRRPNYEEATRYFKEASDSYKRGGYAALAESATGQEYMSQAMTELTIGSSSIKDKTTYSRDSAAKLLKESAKAFERAGQDRKRLDALRLLDKVIPHQLPQGSISPILSYLASSFATDFRDRKLPREECGWRSLMDIVESLQIPRSQVYGEPRYGRQFGRQLDVLVKESLVELRIFPKGRGRGGQIKKVRANLKNPNVSSYVDELTS